MNNPLLLLCTDMDRTIIPNGIQPEHPKARKRFADFCSSPQITLAYVTGRHLTLVQQAIKTYALPEPDFAITDVGTKIYHIEDHQWLEWTAWEKEIDQDWKGHNFLQIKKMIGLIPSLHMQEYSKQNTHKLSYYLPLHADKDKIISQVSGSLEEHGIEASLIWSIDEPKNIGLLDVLPRNATKLHAIEFLQQQLGFKRNEVIFAGDSGNDLPVLGSGISSVLVANASEEVKEMAQQMAERNGHADALYIAKGNDFNENGNYSAGILEGIGHFAPDFLDKINQVKAR